MWKENNIFDSELTQFNSLNFGFGLNRESIDYNYSFYTDKNMVEILFLFLIKQFDSSFY